MKTSVYKSWKTYIVPIVLIGYLLYRHSMKQPIQFELHSDIKIAFDSVSCK